MPRPRARPIAVVSVLLLLLVLAAAVWLGREDPGTSTAVVERSEDPLPVASPRLEGASGARVPGVESGDGDAAPGAAASGATLAVAGTMRRADGEPVANGWVDVTVLPRDRTGPGAVREQRIQVDDEGRFRLEGLPPGRVRLVALPALRSDGGRASTVTDAGDEHVELLLSAASPERHLCRVSLSIADRVSGRAPVDTRLALYVTVDGKEALVKRQVYEPQERPPPGPQFGHYDAVPGTICTFRVVAVGYAQERPVVVAIPHDAPELPVRLELTPAPDRVAHLTLHLVTDGRQVPEIVVGTCRHPDVPDFLEDLVEHDRVTLALPPGPQELTVEGPWDRDDEGFPAGVQVGDLAVEMAGGERREIELRLRAGGFVFLVGDPDAWRPEFALTRPGRILHRIARNGTWEEEDGYFLGPLPPGRWALSYDGTDAHYAGEVEVPAEGVTRIHRDALESTPLPDRDR